MNRTTEPFKKLLKGRAEKVIVDIIVWVQEKKTLIISHISDYHLFLAEKNCTDSGFLQ